MGLFGKPSDKDIKDFTRGRKTSAKAAQAHADREHERERARRAAKAIRDGRKRK